MRTRRIVTLIIGFFALIGIYIARQYNQSMLYLLFLILVWTPFWIYQEIMRDIEFKRELSCKFNENKKYMKTQQDREENYITEQQFKKSLEDLKKGRYRRVA